MTSQATPFQFGVAIKEVLDRGDTPIIITLSSGLSGTYHSACLAAREFDVPVPVVDSLSLAIGQGILVKLGVRLAKEGKSADEIVRILEEKKKDLIILALIDTLDYLQRGGRISKGAALAGKVLSVKPVVTTENGVVKLLGQARGSKQGNNYLMRTIEENGGVDFSLPLCVGYTGNDRSLMDRYVEDCNRVWKGQIDEIPVATVGGAIGTHIGPGGITVAFFRKKA